MGAIKSILISFLITSLSSCNNSHDTEKYDNKVDTIFAGDAYPTDKKISIKLDNGKDFKNLIFKIKEPTLVGLLFQDYQNIKYTHRK